MEIAIKKGLKLKQATRVIRYYCLINGASDHFDLSRWRKKLILPLSDRNEKLIFKDFFKMDNFEDDKSTAYKKLKEFYFEIMEKNLKLVIRKGFVLKQNKSIKRYECFINETFDFFELTKRRKKLVTPLSAVNESYIFNEAFKIKDINYKKLLKEYLKNEKNKWK